jgi:hypothetical protein
LKFFIPDAKSEEDARLIYGGLRNLLSEKRDGMLAVDRIFRIVHRLGRSTMTAEVGRPHPHAGKTVITILFEPRWNLYLVCTQRGGSRSSETIAVKREDVDTVELFEDG